MDISIDLPRSNRVASCSGEISLDLGESHAGYKFLDEKPAHIPMPLQSSFLCMDDLLATACDLPFLTTQSIHVTRALYHALIRHAMSAPEESELDYRFLDMCDEFRSHVDDLDDLFEEMDATTDEFQPPLAQWQTKLDRLFTDLGQADESGNEIQRSYTTMSTLKAVDWRQYDRAKFDNQLITHDNHAIQSSYGVEWVSSTQLEPWSSWKPASLHPAQTTEDSASYSLSMGEWDEWIFPQLEIKYPIQTIEDSAPYAPSMRDGDQRVSRQLDTQSIVTQQYTSSPIFNRTLRRRSKSTSNNGASSSRGVQGKRRPRYKPYDRSNTSHSPRASEQSPTKFKCIYEGCEHETDREENLKKHIDMVHLDWSCPICARGFTQRHNGPEHIARSHHIEHKCPVCAKPLDRKQMVQHLEDPHSTCIQTISRTCSAQPENRSHTAGEVPNLTGQVPIAASRPVFGGTYSSVYLGRCMVTVKVIRLIKHPDAMRRKARRELETWWSLRHPNILPCLGYVEAEGLGEYGALVTPWCRNGNASDYLAESPPHSQRVEMLLDVARGVRYLHQHNPTLVHGDLKPENIVIDETFNAKICDFGLVRLIRGYGSSTGLTTTSAYTGTTRYLAYELVEGGEMPTTASDVHALGCVGLEFLFSQMPYAQIPSDRGNAYFKICREITRGTPPAEQPDRLDTDILEFWSLLELCWQIQIDRRPGVNDIVHHLEQYCSRRYLGRSEAPHARHRCKACQHPGIKSPKRSLQPTLNSPRYLHITLFLLTPLFLVFLRFIWTSLSL